MVGSSDILGHTGLCGVFHAEQSKSRTGIILISAWNRGSGGEFYRVLILCLYNNIRDTECGNGPNPRIVDGIAATLGAEENAGYSICQRSPQPDWAVHRRCGAISTSHCKAGEIGQRGLPLPRRKGLHFRAWGRCCHHTGCDGLNPDQSLLGRREGET